jgi:hypothetical protein
VAPALLIIFAFDAMFFSLKTDFTKSATIRFRRRRERRARNPLQTLSLWLASVDRFVMFLQPINAHRLPTLNAGKDLDFIEGGSLGITQLSKMSTQA